MGLSRELNEAFFFLNVCLCGCAPARTCLQFSKRVSHTGLYDCEAEREHVVFALKKFRTNAARANVIQRRFEKITVCSLYVCNEIFLRICGKMVA